MCEPNNGEYKKVPLIENGEKKIEVEEIIEYGYGVRHVQALLLFLSICVAFIAKAHIGVTIVAMTNIPNRTAAELNHNLILTNTTSIESDFLSSENNTGVDYNNKHGTFDVWDEFQSDNANDTKSIYRRYNWPKRIQELILSAFFLGFLLTQILMSMVAQRWGGILPLQFGLLLNGLVSIVTPWLTLWGGWRAVAACRLIQGLSQGGFLVSSQILLSEWMPLSERGRLTSYVYTGSTFGTAISFQFGGILSASSWGWPSCFWFIGGLCLLMFILLTVFGAATPFEHKTISETERRFITQSRSSDTGVKKKQNIPWKEILTSKHVWAIYVTHIGSGVISMFLLVQVSSYVHYMLGVNIKNSGLLSSLPYFTSMLASVIFGIVSDYCTNHKIVSRNNARRISNSVSQIGAAACLLGVAFTKNVTLSITLLIISISMQAGNHTGWMVNYIDLAPNFSGSLTAIGNTLCFLCVIITPVFVSNIITDVTNQYQWRIVFMLIAGFAILTNSIYVAFMSADEQPWNSDNSEVKDVDDVTEEKCKDKKEVLKQ